MTVTAEQLRQVPLFASLNDKALRQILQIGHEVVHKAGEAVVEKDHGGVGFHLIIGGSAEVRIGDALVATFGPGDYFGEMSVLDGKPRSATVTAMSDLTTLSIAAWDLERLLDQHPTLMRSMLTELTSRIRRIEATRS
jgi:CRP/FNR family cyclic AMP-dependent transcriptional regulator